MRKAPTALIEIAKHLHLTKKGRGLGLLPRAAALRANKGSAAHERNALSSHGLAPQYFRRGGA